MFPGVPQKWSFALNTGSIGTISMGMLDLLAVCGTPRAISEGGLLVTVHDRNDHTGRRGGWGVYLSLRSYESHFDVY